MLVIQGESDPFGMPPDAPGREVVVVPGTHSFTRGGLGVLTEAARELARAALGESLMCSASGRRQHAPPCSRLPPPSAARSCSPGSAWPSPRRGEC